MKQISTLLFIICFSIPTTTIYGMKQKFIKNLPRIGKTISGVLAVGTPLAESLLNLAGSSKTLANDDIDPITNDFIHSHIKTYGVKNSDAIILKMIPENIRQEWHVNDMKNTLFIPKNVPEEIKKALKESQLNSTEILDIKTSLAHECSHLINQDCKNKTIFKPIAALTSHIAVNTLIEISRKKLSPIPTMANAIVWTLAHFGSLELKFVGMEKLEALYSRYLEKKRISMLTNVHKLGKS